jgi:UDP-N-acetylglucosamine acyltransferase
MPIHPTAIIEPGAEVHPTASVGAYSIVETGAVVGADCVIETCARVYGHTRIGRGNRVGHGVALGAEPQDLGFTPEKASSLTIGDDNHFKEGVTISHGTKSEAGTRIGSRNYFMSYAHAGHDCVIGDDNILANSATLAGHVELAHHIFIAGLVAVHQFARIGAYVMVGGITGVSKDIPPFVMANGQRARIIGLNTVGLRRNGFDPAQRNRIKAAYRLIFRSGLPRAAALERALAEQPGAETEAIVDFIRASRRGVISFEHSESQ